MDTTSKDDMIHVLLELRSKKFPSGESVKARLKSAVVLSTDGAPVDFRYTNTDAHMLFEAQIQGDKKTAQGNAGKKRKSGANKGKSNAAQNKNAKGGKINGNTQRRSNSGTNVPKQNNKKNGSKQEDRPKAPPQAPPSLGEDHFPSLSNDDIMNKNKIEVEKLPDQRPEDEMEKARTSSDSASTATTTSSSSSSKNAPSSSQQFIGGYAAALLKAAPPMKAKPVEQKQPLSEKTPISGKKDDKKSSPLSKDRNTRKEGAKKNTNKKAIDGQSTSAIAVSVQPPKWGGGLSFADVLRKEAAAAVAAAPQKSSS